MSFTNYTEAGVLAYVLGIPSTFVATQTPFVALYTAAPSETGGGTEVSVGDVNAVPPTATGYVRQPATFALVAGNPTVASNTGNIAFPTALNSYGTVTHVGVADAATAGNLLAYAMLQTPATVNTGDQFQIQTGNLRITLE